MTGGTNYQKENNTDKGHKTEDILKTQKIKSSKVVDSNFAKKKRVDEEVPFANSSTRVETKGQTR